MSYATIRADARELGLRRERTDIRRALVRNRWSPTLAAAELGISASTLYRALDRHSLLRAEFAAKAPRPGPVRLPKQ